MIQLETMQSYFWIYAQVFFTVVVISTCWGIAWYSLAATAMLNQRIEVKRCVLFCVYFSVVQLVVNFLMLVDVKYIELYPKIVPLLFTLHAAVLVLLQHQKGREPLTKTMASVALSYFFIYSFFRAIQIATLVPLEKALASEIMWISIGSLVLVYLASLAFSIMMSFFLKKVKFGKYWGHLFTGRVKRVVTLFICVFLMYFFHIMPFINDEWEAVPTFSIAMFVSMFTILAILLFLAIFERNRSKLAAQQLEILQQQTYVQTLEDIQDEVRAFRHDYQNVMSGLFLQAQQGDTEGIQQQLRQKLQYFDTHLSDKIRQTTHLANIESPQVKSLLMIKMQKMQQAGVQCEVEIVSPVKKIGMETDDFLRVLGVFLDNAAEAAAAAEKAFVGIILLAEKDHLCLVIKNTFDKTGAPAVTEVWKQGYSSKGAGRGMGLFGVQQILDRLARVVTCRTAIEDELFVQELVIATGGAL